MLALFVTQARPAPQPFKLALRTGEVITVEATPLEKAETPAGARWITVKAPGHEKGQPVMVQETQHGSGVWRVVAGAGGSLNYLKLRGLKDPGKYANDVRQRQADKRQADKRQAKADQTKKDKDAGVHESKQKQRQQIHAQHQAAEEAFVRTIAKHAGWDDKQLAFPEDKAAGLSDKAAATARLRHHRGLVRQAKQFADLQAKALSIAADARLADATNEPLDDRPPPSGGLGYTPHYAERTEKQAADIAAEAGEVDAARKDPDEQRRSRDSAASAKAIRDELAGQDFGGADLKAQVLDLGKQMEVMKARKALQKATQAARKAAGAVDRGEEKAYIMEVGAEPTDAEIQRDVENDLKTMRTRAFLSEVGRRTPGEHALGRHLAVGAYNALNSVSLVAAGIGAVDRDVVDVLGIAGAAQALATRLRKDLPPEDYKAAVEAMEKYHVDYYLERSDSALRQAAELEDQIKELTLPEAANGEEIANAHELNHRRQGAIADTQKLLGQALGEMEANAALVAALKGSDQDLKVPLGKLNTLDAVRRLRAVGLNRGDYKIEHAGGEVIATVKPEGLLRVAVPIDAEHARATRDSLDIIAGRQDDPDFWPQGVARRPDLALPPPKPAASHDLAQPFTAGPDMEASLRDYIGGRMADGHAIGDILNDLHSDDLARLAGDRRADYFRALGEVVPLVSKDGKPVEAEARRPEFEKYADHFVTQKYGGQFAPIHVQSFAVDQHSADALHRAFSATPEGPLAFKPVGDLEAADQGALRRYFDKHLAPPDEKAADLRAKLEAHAKLEPERETDDMFGRGTNPEWTAWNSKGADLRSQLSKTALNWNKYTTIMGSPEAAYRAVQDHLRGAVVKDFHDHYSKLAPDAPLKLGRTVISNHLRHVDAVDPEVRERRIAEHRETVDRLRTRAAGRYAGGSVAEKLDRVREHQAAMEQSQLGMFGAAPDEDTKKSRRLDPDERYTLGQAAETRLAQMAENIGQNFKPGEPAKVWEPSMTGKFAAQQRGIKLIERNKRLALGLGVGSGKTSLMLSAFAHLKSKGKIKRALALVPSIVQGQFGSEALSMLEPGKFKWHIAPGASQAERIAHYADPGTNFSVVTHQAFRDDLIHLGAKAAGLTEQQMADKLNAMPAPERKAWAAETMKGAGMDHDMLMVDEGHNLLNRAGKENSLLANVVDAVSENTPYYVNSTADTIKNDLSEAHDTLRKMDPARYRDRESFMRRYGIDTEASKDALRREMARYLYADHIKPGIQVHSSEQQVPLSHGQQQAIDEIEANIAKLRISRLGGEADVKAARALSPDSFEGQPEEAHAGIAQHLARSVGVLRQTALARAIDAHPESSKLEAIARYAHARQGKPGVIFARSLDAVENIAKRLTKEGHRVVTITGRDTAKQKSAKRLKFRPDVGEPEADILVASDAGAVGLNAQRGAWLVQNDTPLTAMTHNQRRGRINRLGQLNPEIELTDMVANHPHEREARRRLNQKYGLRDIVTSPLEKLDDRGFAPYLRAARAAQEQDGAR